MSKSLYKRMNQTCTIKEMLEDERPYEKCLRYGVENLSNAELLAVLLRTGTRGTNSLEMARNILRTSEQEEDNILAVHQLTMEKLKAIKGIGTVKATQILCLSELAISSCPLLDKDCAISITFSFDKERCLPRAYGIAP